MKKVLLTLLDIVVVLIADYWCLWLNFYFGATIDGAIYVSSPYLVFERNYLVPAQIIFIPIIVTVISVALYRNLREKKLIGKKYIALVLFNVIPLCIMCVLHIITLCQCWREIY